MERSKSLENYLKAIFILSGRQKDVRAVELARYMNYSKASVSIALKKLRGEGYVTVDGAGGIALTELGRRTAAGVLERHSFFERLLLDAGVSKEQAHIDACKLEHDLSEESFAALCAETP